MTVALLRDSCQRIDYVNSVKRTEVLWIPFAGSVLFNPRRRYDVQILHQV